MIKNIISSSFISLFSWLIFVLYFYPQNAILISLPIFIYSISRGIAKRHRADYQYTGFKSKEFYITLLGIAYIHYFCQYVLINLIILISGYILSRGICESRSRKVNVV
jgi:hypothetical protein